MYIINIAQELHTKIVLIFLFQVQCDMCDRWFHVTCTPAATTLGQLSMEAFNCQSCLTRRIDELVVSCTIIKKIS